MKCCGVCSFLAITWSCNVIGCNYTRQIETFYNCFMSPTFRNIKFIRDFTKRIVICKIPRKHDTIGFHCKHRLCYTFVIQTHCCKLSSNLIQLVKGKTKIIFDSNVAHMIEHITTYSRLY